MLDSALRAVAVFAGGVLGTLARWAIAQAVPPPAGGFPVATFVANTSGAFALGFVSIVLLERLPTARYARLLLGVGFLGAYTTFSTMAVEGIQLLSHGSWKTAALYWIATLVVGQMCGVYGMWLARLRRPRRGTHGTER